MTLGQWAIVGGAWGFVACLWVVINRAVHRAEAHRRLIRRLRKGLL